MHVKVPTNIIRNEDVHLSNGSFMLYVRLCLLYFKNHRKGELKVSHKKLMTNTGIIDTRTLKKRLKELHSNGLMLNEIKTFPKKGEMLIHLNGKVIDECKHFTMMNLMIFNYIDQLDEHSFRLLFYYKSHINKDDKKNKRNFCFVGMNTLTERLKMAKKTIQAGNKLLVENKLIKIQKHKLEDSGTYDENDELIFEKYNNHYFIKDELFKK